MRAFFLFLLCVLGSLHAAAPVVSNISAAQRANSRLVDITYDVAADFPTVSVSLQVSSNGGSTFTVPATTLSGAIGAGVTTGTAKKITWDAGNDWSGQYSTQMRFKVIADDGNSVPTISDIAAQTINQGSNTGTIAFTIGDAQTAATSLSLSASSSNTTLVPNANIVFGGSGANRTVTVSPVSSQSGTATITVTVSDGSLICSDVFVLKVNANTPPTISGIAAQSLPDGGNTGAITFKVGDDQTAPESLILTGISSNTGLVPNGNIVFDGSGTNRTVTVNCSLGMIGTTIITLTISDGTLSSSETFIVRVPSAVSNDFSLIPEGEFMMGDSLDNISDAPVRKVFLNEFYIGKYEVTKDEWDEVRNWALSNGYTDLNQGKSNNSNYPVETVSWYDAVKWCNARSEKEGLTPVYYTNDAQTNIYRIGNIDITNNQVRWGSNGYRLPTEAEWEKAARGGLNGNRFPWGDTISHSQANYFSNAGYSYDVSPTRWSHPSYPNVAPVTSPVGVFAANGYDLYDTAGNVQEMCWDWYGPYDPNIQLNPLGPKLGVYRILRGGHWYSGAAYCRTANRDKGGIQGGGMTTGFRVVRLF